MIILPEDKSGASYAGSQLGRSISEAFGQTFPEALQRGRLSGALNQLQRGGQMSPIQQLSSLYGAGATDQQVGNLIPLLQQMQQQQAMQKRIQGQAGIQEQPKIQQSIQQQQNQIGEEPTSSLLVKPQHEEATRNRILPLTPEQLNQEALQRVQNGEFLKLQDAKAAVQEEHNERIARQNAIIEEGQAAQAQREQLRKAALTAAGFQVGNEAGEAASFEHVPGNVQDRILTKEEELVASGKKTVAQAASDAGREMKEIAKMRNDLKTHHAQNFWDPRKNVQYDRAAQKEYAKRGMLDEYKLDLISRAGMTDEQATRVAYPLSSEIKSMYKKIPNRIYAHGKDLSAKDYENLAKHISKDDSAVSIADSLKQKGYDPYEFLEVAKDLYQRGEIALTDRQVQEMNKKVDFTRSLGDIWYSLGE